MDAYDYLKFVAWLKDSKRQPAIFAFTAGEVRDAAYAVEQSGILAQFAAEASAVETLKAAAVKTEAMMRRRGEQSGGSWVSIDCELRYAANELSAALAALVQAEGKEKE